MPTRCHDPAHVDAYPPDADHRPGGGDTACRGRETALPREFVEERAPRYREIALINAVVIGGLLTLCGVFVLRGARWARVAASVVGALGICGGALTLVNRATPLLTDAPTGRGRQRPAAAS